jgi:competence protein ComEC
MDWSWGGLLLALTVTRLLPSLRLLAAMTCAGLLVMALVSPAAGLPGAGVVVLDVGQGDAILVHGGEGRFALVDGGPDEAGLIEKLNDYGVRSLDLMVLTHVHADHATGLRGVVGRISIGQVWADIAPHSSAASTRLMAALETHRVRVAAPKPGTVHRLGSLELVVEGPVRRYASPNDQSIVLMVSGTDTMLLSGDIETHAQADLDELAADVLKVPHQGAGTSDPAWLQSVGAKIAVISVGPNEFGHPSEWVVDFLARKAEVRRTDEEGDITIDLMR